MFFTSGVSSTDYPDRNCGAHIAVPLLISIPSLIRLRQCLIEFYRVRRAGYQAEGWGGQHLANALKYASALPSIILRALQRDRDSQIGLSKAGLHRLWYNELSTSPLLYFYSTYVGTDQMAEFIIGFYLPSSTHYIHFTGTSPRTGNSPYSPRVSATILIIPSASVGIAFSTQMNCIMAPLSLTCFCASHGFSDGQRIRTIWKVKFLP
jgi:hypothetical protein